MIKYKANRIDGVSAMVILEDPDYPVLITSSSDVPMLDFISTAIEEYRELFEED